MQLSHEELEVEYQNLLVHDSELIEENAGLKARMSTVLKQLQNKNREAINVNRDAINIAQYEVDDLDA